MKFISFALALLFCTSGLAFDVVTDGGADPTFVRDSTSAFLKAAKFTTDNAQGIVSQTGTTASSPSVNVPFGRYKISDEITGWGYTTIVGNNAIIKQTDSTKRTFVFDKSSKIDVRSLQFLGGSNAISITNPNINASHFIVNKCIFRETSKYAITTTDHLSAVLTIKDCEFHECYGCFDNTCDMASVEDCWVDGFTGPFCFNNVRGTMSLNRNMLVPTQNTTGHYWISNYSQLFCNECRFSGEGGGLPVLKHNSSLGQMYPFMGSMVVFSKCQLSAGPVSMADSAIVTLDKGLPQLLKFTDCNYMVGVSIIESVGNVSFTLAEVSRPELLKIVFEDCVSWPPISLNAANSRLDSKLLPYIKVR